MIHRITLIIKKNEFLNLARTSLKKNGALLWCDKNTLN